MKKINFKIAAQIIFAQLFLVGTSVNAAMVAPLRASEQTGTISSDKATLCPDRLTAYENIQLQQSMSSDGKRCYFGIHPRDAFETLIYRDYLLTDDGLFMVFNSFSAELKAPSDGAREFYFLPSEFTGFEWKVEGEYLVVTGFEDRILKFSLKTAQLKFISGAEVKLAEKVSADNKGGLEILNPQFVLIDAGFKFGDSPSADKSKSSVFTNSTKQKCTVKNAKVYDYADESAYLKDLESLRAAVEATCAGFLF